MHKKGIIRALIIFTLSFFIFGNIFTNNVFGNNLTINNYNNIIDENKLINIYSPFDGKIDYINGQYLIYNKNKNIIIKISGFLKNKTLGNIKKGDLIGIINKDKFAIKSFLNSVPQNYKINLFFYKLLLNNKLPLKINLNININNKSFLDKIKGEKFFDKDYKMFFTGLKNFSSKRIITEQELLTYKMATNKKFIDIAENYKNKTLILSKIERDKYTKMYKYISCLYNNVISDCDETYKEEYNYFHTLIKKTYGHQFIPYNKTYFTKIIKKNGQENKKKYTIPDWKINKYAKYNIDKEYFLTLAAINSQECGLEDGSCFNGADAGPFQINQIHRKDFLRSKKEVFQIKNTKNKINQNKLKEDLFDYQLKWTINRLNRLKTQFCKNKYGDNLTRCLAILHNGNKARTCYRNGRYIEFRYCYADSVVRKKREYKRFYNLK